MSGGTVKPVEVGSDVTRDPRPAVVDLTKPGGLAIALVDAIVEMSDHAESLGGATSISGVAALHKMQTSIQKNKHRIIKALRDAQVSA